MSGHGRPLTLLNCPIVYWAAACVAFVATALTISVAAPPPIAPGQFQSLANGDPAMPAPDSATVEPAESAALLLQRNDARLNDIAFVDPQRGWAVGDAGAIWHTADGGHHWQPQSSGVDCRLLSVCFLNAENGRAVGGRTEPYTHLTRGVLLHTSDGGQHWAEDKKLLLPALRGIRFANAARGWAYGAASALYPSGIFFTDNGGRDWTPLAAPSDSIARPAVSSTPSGGAAFTRDGVLLTINRRQAQPAAGPPLGLASVRRIAFASPTAGWLVGDGGLILATEDGGRTWPAVRTV